MPLFFSFWVTRNQCPQDGMHVHHLSCQTGDWMHAFGITRKVARSGFVTIRRMWARGRHVVVFSPCTIKCTVWHLFSERTLQIFARLMYEMTKGQFANVASCGCSYASNILFPWRIYFCIFYWFQILLKIKCNLVILYSLFFLFSVFLFKSEFARKAYPSFIDLANLPEIVRGCLYI